MIEKAYYFICDTCGKESELMKESDIEDWKSKSDWIFVRLNECFCCDKCKQEYKSCKHPSYWSNH